MKEQFKLPIEEFEDAIYKFGVVAACEYFGYSSESDFTKEMILMFKELKENEHE